MRPFAMQDLIPHRVALVRLQRAKSRVGKGTRYKLGKGGFDPRATMPSTDGRCDCSGFVSWVIGVSRHRVGSWWTSIWPWSQSPWLETSNVVKDAKSGNPRSVFVKIPKPEVGAIVVYGDRAGREGHMAIVARVWADEKQFAIIDCSSRSGDAIPGERPGNWMVDRGAIFCTLRQDLV